MEPNEVFAFVDIEPVNLLQTLKRDLLELEDHAAIGLKQSEWATSSSKRVLAAEDRSVSLHLCHSPQREVEVLQDRLLAMMDADPSLTARDIIVMVSDIDAYTPFIQAVFGNATPERALPFAISDRSASQAHPALQAFISCSACRTAALLPKRCWGCWKCPPWPPDLRSMKRLRLLRHWVGNPAFAGGWMMTTCASWSCPPPASTHGISA